MVLSSNPKATSGKWKVVGTMSGTSLDGLDICVAEFKREEGRWSFEILTAETIPYPEEWKDKLTRAPQMPDDQLAQLDDELSSYIGHQVRAHLVKNQVNDALLVGSHGHTVFHQPEKQYTLQIGNTSKIREAAGLPVVCDFRVQDVELGGQGAPLVPIGDALLFSEYDVCLNLGGFANLSVTLEGERKAWDVCPVNIGINHFTRKLGLEFDRNGHIAASNAMDGPAFYHINQLPFFSQEAPKSLGREWFEKNVLPSLDRLSEETAIATLTGVAAYQLAKAIEELGAQTILCTGGGAYNTHLINMVKQSISGNLIVPDANLVEYKEALLFAFLGLLKWEGESNVLASVTGASSDHSSGVVFS